MKRAAEPGVLERGYVPARTEAPEEEPAPAYAPIANETTPADTEVVGDIVAQAREVQRVAEKIYFLSLLKRFGLAFGGILILLGVFSATAFFLLFFGIFSTGLERNLELLLQIGLGLLASIHILAGLALLAG